MSAFKTSVRCIALAASLVATASWAGGFQLPHHARQAACPTAVENVGQTSANSWGMNVEASNKTAGDNGKTKGQNGLLLPAVKQGAVGKAVQSDPPSERKAVDADPPSELKAAVGKQAVGK